MGNLKDMLEPGERVVLRQPKDSGKLGLAMWLLEVLLSWLVYYLFIRWISNNYIEPYGYVISLYLPIYVLGRMRNALRWKVAVTDRRLLVNESAWFRKKQWEARLDEIESISMDYAAYRIEFRAGGRKTECHPEKIDLSKVKEAIGRAEEATP